MISSERLAEFQRNFQENTILEKPPRGRGGLFRVKARFENDLLSKNAKGQFNKELWQSSRRFWELVFLKKSLEKFAEDLRDTAKLQDLVTFTEEVLIGKLHFLCSVTVQ